MEAFVVSAFETWRSPLFGLKYEQKTKIILKKKQKYEEHGFWLTGRNRSYGFVAISIIYTCDVMYAFMFANTPAHLFYII